MGNEEITIGGAATLRLVRAPDGQVAPDFKGELPARQEVWLECTRAALEQAWLTGQITAALGEDVTLPDPLAERVEAGLLKRVQEAIALARKGGHAVCGFAKVAEMLSARQAALLLEAEGAGAADAAKLLRKAEGIPVSHLLSREELGKPFGREECVHVAIRNPAMAAFILKEIRRLAGFREKNAL